jgi:glutathione peroxidase
MLMAFYDVTVKDAKGVEVNLSEHAWNFTKFLINKRGEVVARFAPIKTPAAIEADIVKFLEA